MNIDEFYPATVERENPVASQERAHICHMLSVNLYSSKQQQFHLLFQLLRVKVKHL